MIDTAEGRSKASLLINKMYAWRGYAGTHKLTDDPNRITLTASDKGDVVGTLTIGLDSPAGILADEIFKEEIDRYRAQGARVCEMTKLAFDLAGPSQASMASLFHLSVIHVRDIYQCTHIFIEVNPRHRRFYERMLGFQRIGEAKMNPRVNAPAYLLCVELDYVTEQIQQHGGKGTGATAERSFYNLFFSPREETGLINRIKNNT
ncbi:N-acyl amino acid synthase FeeM domain-containing protein [Duganella callida]|nr:N-acetyltransferase [Duganella callida]